MVKGSKNLSHHSIDRLTQNFEKLPPYSGHSSAKNYWVLKPNCAGSYQQPLKNAIRGSFFLNFGDFDSLEAPLSVKQDLLISDLSNPIDLCRLNSVAIEEDVLVDIPFMDNHLNL